MSNSLSATVVSLGIGLTFGCGDANVGREPSTDRIGYPDGFPAMTYAVSVSDLCEGTTSQTCALARHPPSGATLIELSQPEPGRLCMSGRIGSNGWAFLATSYSVYGGDGIEQIFDADALGITQVRFKLDGPPSTGVRIMGMVVKSTHCPEAPHLECREDGFYLTDPKANKVLEFKKSAEIVMPFADFVQQDAGGMRDFDTSKLEGFLFYVNSAGPVNFCISDFDFLDEDGNVVTL